MNGVRYTVGCVLLAAGCWFSSAADAAPPSPAERYKTNQPIEINSDSLEVYQEENRAIFIGHVIAIQGDVRLKADKMTVYYRKPEEKAGTVATKATGDNASEKDAIKRIDVEGGVFLATPEETASGDSGNYDVENQKIFLNNNVVLTRGQNVLKGDKLVYNFNTGKSVITGGDNPAQATTSGPHGSQRVHALFVPSGNETKNLKNNNAK